MPWQFRKYARTLLEPNFWNKRNIGTDIDELESKIKGGGIA